MEDLLEFDAEKAVSSAMDSLALIDNLKVQDTLTEEDTDSLSRNVEHIKIMLSKPEFISALTTRQKEMFSSAVL